MKTVVNAGNPSPGSTRRAKAVREISTVPAKSSGASKRKLKVVAVENVAEITKVAESTENDKAATEIADTEKQAEEKPVKTKRTITLNAEAEYRIRIWAAEHKTTVSHAIEQLICNHLD